MNGVYIYQLYTIIAVTIAHHSAMHRIALSYIEMHIDV